MELSGSQPQAAPKGKRVLADIFDLVVVPIVLGIVAGLLLLKASDAVRAIIMVILNIAWLLIRDTVFAPGRALVGIKLISLTGDKVTLSQAVIRNLLLVIPGVLLVGYVIEIISVLAKNQRLSDNWAKTRVVSA